MFQKDAHNMKTKVFTKFITKLTALILILGLLPLASNIVVRDYDGVNLVAAEDSKIKKRKRVNLPSKIAQ